MPPQAFRRYNKSDRCPAVHHLLIPHQLVPYQLDAAEGTVMARGVIFDIDGTLVDSVDLHARAWQEAFHRFGFDIPYPFIRVQIGKGSDQLLPALLPKKVVDEQGPEIDSFRADLFKRDYLPQVKPFPGVRALFERIKAGGGRIALASSAKGDELEAYERIAQIGDLVETATSSAEADRSKPNPDIFEVALGRLRGIDRAEIVVVGDTPYDAEAAGKAGLRTIGVTAGGWAPEKLRAAGCEAVYHDPAELLREYERTPLAKDL
jgi:HAD superfamily hydrolase (TIGR01509 family)